MGGSHKVPSDSPASRPQELEPQHQLGGTTQIPQGKPRSSREKFTQLTANMEYLYPQPPAGPAPTYLLPVDILGVVRDDGLAGHVIGTTDTARPRPNYSESARKNKTKKQKTRECPPQRPWDAAEPIKERATTSSGLRPNPAHTPSPDQIMLTLWSLTLVI